MRNFRKAVFALCFLTQNLIGQNLVPNGSFEEYNICPRNITPYKQDIDIPYWYSPTKGSPDYYNSCSKFNVGIPNNFMGYLFAKNGNAYVGILLTEKPDRINNKLKPYNEREYIQVKLNSPLKKDHIYEVRLYYSIAQYSLYAVNTLGICISENRPPGKKVLNCNSLYVENTINPYHEKGEWFLLVDTIVANGGEVHLTIGSFQDDYNTKYKKTEYLHFRNSIQNAMLTNGYAYYFIDVVKVIELKNRYNE